MPELVSSGPLLLTRYEERESLHPELGHLSITTVAKNITERKTPPRDWGEPLPDWRQQAYFDSGFITETLFENEFKRRQGLRVKKLEEPDLVLQHKICEPIVGIHLIPDGYVPEIRGYEFKATFGRKSNPDYLFEDHPAWLLQTQAYGHILDIYEWEFCVMWLRGTFPEPVKYKFKYSEAECLDTWEAVAKEARLIRKKNSTEA